MSSLCKFQKSLLPEKSVIVELGESEPRTTVKNILKRLKFLLLSGHEPKEITQTQKYLMQKFYLAKARLY
jgi:hypothetical protein